MQHSKSYILSLGVEEALGQLCREIENLENKVDDLKYKIQKLESERG